jgi:U3 small nucleolar RNA-associated protein 10
LKDRDYHQLMDDYLTPCVAQLAVAAGKEELWKRLNQYLLIMSRNDDPQVRLTTVSVVEAMYGKLGEQSSVLLPQAIPFLSELMEDESEDVERKTKSTLAIIEKLTGESIQDYFY